LVFFGAFASGQQLNHTKSIGTRLLTLIEHRASWQCAADFIKPTYNVLKSEKGMDQSC